MKIAFFDTESTGLTAIMGRILCASFMDEDGELETYTYEEYPGTSAIDDSVLCVAIRDRLEEANMIVGWNSKLHDIPLLNARLAKAGERGFNPHLHLDLMWYSAGSSMKIGSRKLDNVAKYFKVKHQKTELDWDTWSRASAGDGEALDEVVEHCEADVLVLSDVYEHLLPYVRNIHK